MKTFIKAMGALCLLYTTSGQAGDFSYTYIEGFFVHTEIDEGPVDEDGDGYRLGASVGIWENLFLFARYQDFDLGGSVDTELTTVGAGLNFDLGVLPMDLILRGGYLDAEVDTPFGDFDDEGFTVGAGLRISLLSILELDGGVDYFELDDFGDGALFYAMARLYLLPILALQAGAEFDEDFDNAQYLAGLRLEF